MVKETSCKKSVKPYFVCASCGEDIFNSEIDKTAHFVYDKIPEHLKSKMHYNIHFSTDYFIIVCSHCAKLINLIEEL